MKLNHSFVRLFTILLSFDVNFTIKVANCKSISYENHLKIIDKIIESESNLSSSCLDDWKWIYAKNQKIQEGIIKFFSFLSYKTKYFFPCSVISSWSAITNSHKYGNSHDFGDFSGCKSINFSEISTQYCMFQYFQILTRPISVPSSKSFLQDLWINLDESFLGAICLPSSCLVSDVHKILGLLAEDRELVIGNNINCKININEPRGWNKTRIM